MCTASTVKYHDSPPPPHHQLVLLWSCCGGGVLSEGHTTRTLYTHHTLCSQSILSLLWRSTLKHAKCDLSTLRFSHRPNFVALCHTVFFSLAVKSRWGALGNLRCSQPRMNFFYEKPRTSRTEYCMIEVVADATVVVKLEHLRRPDVSASATLQCTKKWGGVGTGGGGTFV